ncbi:MAG: hypothetical protein LZF64_13720 [Nitrosomonas sp.]|uniref:hypothetical protein n=1 Tax=Nitrosomonas sp. TaxID=42353 RepID=UPI001A579F3B|nr:hypothetical protein [Nitrosomonas sp.]MBL8499695.1 hypothetical protein [Nitrosomonas sp.]MCG7756838.1 hypothetical protein [Nitrosomonas sp.]UJP00209.1 MAG: hypothetical protein LZF64_13720 [Nitrosomonas sp.]UJP03543.1 MAG: hypothetical protein LZF85_03570 [Nitrosomonas sp.]
MIEDIDKASSTEVMDEIRLILAEKQTWLSMMRTGIAILALPLSVMSVLVATSKFYDVLGVLHFLIPLAILNLALVVLSVYLIIRSIIRIRFYDKLLYKIKLKKSVLADLIE